MCGFIPEELNLYQQKSFLFDFIKYFWYEPYLFTEFPYQINRRCVPEEKNSMKFSVFVTFYRLGVIMEECAQLLRSSKVDTTGHSFTRILTNLRRNVQNSKGNMEHLEDMSFPSSQFLS